MNHCIQRALVDRYVEGSVRKVEISHVHNEPLHLRRSGLHGGDDHRGEVYIDLLLMTELIELIRQRLRHQINQGPHGKLL